MAHYLHEDEIVIPPNLHGFLACCVLLTENVFDGGDAINVLATGTWTGTEYDGVRILIEKLSFLLCRGLSTRCSSFESMNYVELDTINFYEMIDDLKRYIHNLDHDPDKDLMLVVGRVIDEYLPTGIRD